MHRFLSIFFLLLSHWATAQLNLTQLAHLPFDTSTLAGCWHYVDSLGNEYGLIGTSHGLSIVDLSQPTQPEVKFSVPGITNNWREVRTWAGFAYVVSEAFGSGVTIVDLRELPDSITYKVWTGDSTHVNIVQSAHAVGAEEGYLYLYGSNPVCNGAIIASLSDPWNPTVTGLFSQVYLHDGFVRGDTMWGSAIYGGYFNVIDISDRSNPVLITSQGTPKAFNHNSWLSDDHRTLYTTDEVPNSPVGAFDVSDLNDIKLIDTYFPSQKPEKEVHNVRVLHDWLINPSYGGQLTIVDAHKPDNLVETAWVVTSNSLIWDADPFLPSGIIFSTDKNGGVYVYQPTYVRACYLEGLVTDATNLSPINKAHVTLISSSQKDSTASNGVFRMGTITAGTYTALVEKSGYAPVTVENIVLTPGEVTWIDVALSPISAVETPVNAFEIRVTPTMVQSNFMVDMPSQAFKHGAAVSVTDLNGKVILEQPFSTASGELFLPAATAPGIYFVQVKTDQGLSKPIRIVKI